MNKSFSQHILVILLLLFLFTLVACSSAQPEENVPAQQEQVASEVPAQSAPAVLDGAVLIQERCTVCHNLDRVKQAKKSADEWSATVTRMIDKGAKLTQEEQAAVIQFLAKAYP